MHQTETIPQPLQDRDRALDWLTAASPILLIAFFYYRWPIVGLALLAAAGYMAVYALLQWAGLTRMQAPSALAAGVWSALLLSAHTPLWVAAIAGAVAALAAYAPDFAGRWLPNARPLLHPVLMGWLAVRLIFPSYVQTYTLPVLWAPLDAVPVSTALTPLTDPAGHDLWQLFLGVRAGALGTGCVPILLLAAGYLLIRRRLRLIAPAAMVTTVTALSWMVWNAPLHGLLAGSTLLVALLLADRACAPAAYGDQALCGVVAGGVTVLLRAFVGEDGCTVGVLVACLLSPLYPPLVRVCRRGAVWMWGVICRFVPPAAAWVWAHMQTLAGKIFAFLREKICKKQK